MCNRLLEPDIRITGSLSPQIANRGKTGKQRAAQVVRRPANSKCQRFLEYLIVPERFVVRMEQDMGVRIDQTRNQGCAVQLDRAAPSGTFTSPKGPTASIV